MSMFENLAGQTFNLRKDVLSGLTVALALVAEAVAFAFFAGVHPLVGLYAAFMVGLITATLGGRPRCRCVRARSPEPLRLCGR